METVESMSPATDPSAEAPSSVSVSQNLQLILENLDQLAEADLPDLIRLQRESIRLQHNPVDVYQAIANGFLRFGEPLIAYDVLSAGLKEWPQDLELQQLMALALARSGATISANRLLQQLVDQGQQDEKTLSLLARTHKDLWSQATNTQRQHQHLTLAAACYERAYGQSQSSWSGINAATMAFLRGERAHAEAIATQIRQQCLADLEKQEATGDPYWLLATLGEAALILGDFDEAETFYGRAIAVGQGRFGDISSSCRNAKLLIEHQGEDFRLIQQWFQIPRVAVFCGHTVDTPDRAIPRFPPTLEPDVYRAIRDRLTQHNIRFGYASAACGSDILFLEALLEAKGEIHVVLPYERNQFLQDSVDIVPYGQWQQRFDRVLAQATEIIVASQHKVASVNQVFFEYSYRILHGLAKARATQLNSELIPLTVWNGQPSDSIGGTSQAVRYWQQWSETVEVIDLDVLLKASPVYLDRLPAAPVQQFPVSIPTQADRSNNTTLLDFSPEIRAMLFADVVHFTQLREEQFPAFVHHFLGTVAQLSERSDDAPLFQNTWGDALYLVFASVQNAGMFALELCDSIQQVNWQTKGLPDNLNLRIALHAGPVARYRDPITGHENYIGTHVNHTARIEPITPPGKVYASQAFAALASSEGITDFTCDYVGKTPYAKQYGTFPTYHVCRCRP